MKHLLIPATGTIMASTLRKNSPKATVDMFHPKESDLCPQMDKFLSGG
jgi:hypothetical protein